MGYDERRELETRELETRIKEKLSNYPNNRVDFPFDGCDVEWKDEVYEEYEFRIYGGSSWYYDDECLVQSIYINERGKLSFDLLWFGYNCKGNLCGDEVMNDVSLEFIEGRCHTDSQKCCLQAALEFFDEIL